MRKMMIAIPQRSQSNNVTPENHYIEFFRGIFQTSWQGLCKCHKSHLSWENSSAECWIRLDSGRFSSPVLTALRGATDLPSWDRHLRLWTESTKTKFRSFFWGWAKNQPKPLTQRWLPATQQSRLLGTRDWFQNPYFPCKHAPSSAGRDRIVSKYSSKSLMLSGLRIFFSCRDLSFDTRTICSETGEIGQTRGLKSDIWNYIFRCVLRVSGNCDTRKKYSDTLKKYL